MSRNLQREKVFRKTKFFPKKRLANAKLLGENSIIFPINPNRSLIKIHSEINYIKKQATDLGVALPASVNSIDKEVASGISYMNNRIKKLTIATQVGK